MRLSIRLLIIVAFSLLLSSPRIISKGSADGGANHRGRNTHFGVSGGNVNDITKRFCCSGTLGALVTDGTTSYILSNNHVLGLSGKANVGDDISQPGRIDNGCQLPPIVADFTAAPPLGSSNVDAVRASASSTRRVAGRERSLSSATPIRWSSTAVPSARAAIPAL